MRRPKVRNIYEVHWIDILAPGDWNEDPATTDCPTHINFWWLIEPWNLKNLRQVFASTYAIEGKSYHDHQLIPSGAVVLVATLQGEVVYRHPKYIGTPISPK